MVDAARRQIEAERAANAEINKAETRQRQREVRVWRRMARLSEAPPQKPASPVVEAPAKPKPERVISPVAPVILANPPEAPVIISEPPNSSPSQ